MAEATYGNYQVEMATMYFLTLGRTDGEMRLGLGGGGGGDKGAS